MTLPDKDELINKLSAVLHKSGLGLGKITKANAEEVDRAVALAIRQIPALRFIPGGRKRVHGLILLAIDRLPKEINNGEESTSRGD